MTSNTLEPTKDHDRCKNKGEDECGRTGSTISHKGGGKNSRSGCEDEVVEKQKKGATHCCCAQKVEMDVFDQGKLARSI